MKPEGKEKHFLDKRRLLDKRLQAKAARCRSGRARSLLLVFGLAFETIQHFVNLSGNTAEMSLPGFDISLFFLLLFAPLLL